MIWRLTARADGSDRAIIDKRARTGTTTLTEPAITEARPLQTPARALLLIDQPMLAEMVKLALNHGVFVPRVTQDVEQTMAELRDWHPHLAVIDMDICKGQLMDELGASTPRSNRIPVIAYQFLPTDTGEGPTIPSP